MHNPIDLADRRILVTGASSGIGRETAILLSQLHARVVAAGRDPSRLQRTLDGMEGGGHRTEVFDLACADEIPGWFKRLAEAQGPFSGLVHSAGVQCLMPVSLLSASKIDEVLHTNVTAAVMLARAFRQKGCFVPGASIVFLSSISAVAGTGGVSAYAASKAALMGLTRALAIEFSRAQIRVNCVLPGLVRTEMTEQMQASLTPEQFQAVVDAHPLGLGTPRDVAHSIAFLLAETARWITGATLTVDGGYTAK